MHDRDSNTLGVRLDLQDYQADYARRFAVSAGHASWKLERQQYFREPGNPSWDAFIRGEWQESLRIMDSQRADLIEEFREAERLNVELCRVRVVEKPFTQYLHWELYALKTLAECGEKIHVVTSDEIASLETEEPLPEILTVGLDTIYQIVYSADGILEGAVRFVDVETASWWKDVIEQLYHRGEDLYRFFRREVARLEPPIPESPYARLKA